MTRRNITREETTAIKTLREQDIVVKCSDKSKSLVVMSDEIYRQKVMKILGDTENYEESDVTAKTLEERVTKELMKIKTFKQGVVKLHILAQLIESFSTMYGSCRCAEEKIVDPCRSA